MERFRQDVGIVRTQYYTDFSLSESATLRVPNVGVNLFSKRAILRIGMLLRDSPVAREVRTQLLNTFEHSTEEQRTQEILTEQELYVNLGQAFMNGSKEDLLFAGKDIIDYQNRHIRSLEKSNKVLAAEILEWADRASLNKAVRYVAVASDNGFSAIWKELYQELLYKHSINLKSRGGAPYIQHIREGEWSKVQQSLAAICEKYGLDINKVVEVSKTKQNIA